MVSVPSGIFYEMIIHACHTLLFLLNPVFFVVSVVCSLHSFGWLTLALAYCTIFSWHILFLELFFYSLIISWHLHHKWTYVNVVCCIEWDRDDLNWSELACLLHLPCMCAIWMYICTQILYKYLHIWKCCRRRGCHYDYYGWFFCCSIWCCWWLNSARLLVR